MISTTPTTCPSAETSNCPYQGVVKIQCDNGYEIAGGQTSVTLTCGAQKVFNESPPTCQSMKYIYSYS